MDNINSLELERKKFLKQAVLTPKFYFIIFLIFVFLILVAIDILKEYFDFLQLYYTEQNGPYMVRKSYTGKILVAILIPVFGLLFVFVNLFVVDFKEKKLEFANFIKAKIISSMLDPSYKYDPKTGLGSKFINSAGIYANAFYVTHDLIMGVYNGVKFEFCIVETFKEERGYSSDTVGKLINLAYQAKYELSKFNGLILGMKLDKDFNSKTIVVDRAFNTKIDGKVEILDNAAFNDEFRVFSDNPVEARYLLSFVDMEKILKFQNEIALGKASFAFINGKFYIFLNGLHFDYEPSLTLAMNPQKIENFVSNINKTIAYIDFFKDTKDKNG